MAIDVIMPQMGESVSEGTILKWHVHEGDHVEKEQTIVEISTDKIDTEVPSPAAGVVKKIFYPEGKTLPVQTVIASIETAEKKEEPYIKKPEVKIEEEEERPVTVGIPAVEAVGEARRYSPLVRRLAKEHNVPLEEIKGTGMNGRVTKEDVLKYIAARPSSAPEPVIEKPKIEAAKEKETLITLSPKRKLTAERMVQSKHTAAHVTTVFEIDLTKVVHYRERHKESMEKDGIHLTYLPFITLAAVAALKEYPILNSSWTDEGIVQKSYINIGIAVAIEDGLIVPVIKNADKKDLLQLAREIQDIAIRARTKKLKPEDVQGGTFTITNHGINGSLFATPIILLPQVAILGVGTVMKRPVVINEAIAIRSMAYLSLSFDHRVMDGAYADRFLSKIKEILENWEVSIYAKERTPPST